jgi:glycosyltransferase involved in cell wall biosynthesis
MKPAVVFVVLQSGPLANGGLQSITEVMRRLNGYRPIVLTNLDGDRSAEWRSLGIEVHIVPEQASTGLAHNLAGTLWTYLRYHRALKSILRTSRARVVHANDPLSFQLSLTAVKTSHARLLLNLRDTVDPARRPPRSKFRMIFGTADHVLYLSADMAHRWKAVASNATRSSSVTYSVVDPMRFAPSPWPTDNAPMVVVPGTFWPKKGQLDYIRRVVPALAERGIESWFAGDFDTDTNAYAAACASAAEPYADWVKFLGFRDDLPDLFRQASVVAIPSRHEGLMRGMIEAMSCARPVVSFDVCSAREVLEAQPATAGAVLPMADHDGMARELIRFATDRNAQVSAGSAGSEVARNLFNPDAVVERYERVYRKLSKG